MRCSDPTAPCTSAPAPQTGSGAANSLTIIINFMRILCQPLVHRQDGIDLIRISIIEPFGQRLLIRESTKHRRGWGNEGAARSQLSPCHCWFPQMETGARAGKSLQHPKQHPVMELITNSSSSQPQLLRGDTRQPRSRGDSLGQGAMSSPSCPPLCHNLINQASCLAASYFFSPKKQAPNLAKSKAQGAGSRGCCPSSGSSPALPPSSSSSPSGAGGAAVAGAAQGSRGGCNSF